MKIEIWSDVVCPFCYIGKRRLEAALEQFEHRDQVSLQWHSYQLQPQQESIPGKHLTQHLADLKGISLEEARSLNAQITQMATEAGLQYHLEKAVVANSLDAHRLLHLAADRGLQDQAGERLFRAYFTEGKDIADHAVLLALGQDIGLEEVEIRQLLNSDAYAYEVKMDHQEAENLGARGVPFFVIDRKWGIAGAQPTAVFLQSLQKAWEAE